MGLKFRPDSDEEACLRPVLWKQSPTFYPPHKVACLRRKGHPGECMPVAAEAAEADGVHHCCRAKLGGAHRLDCENASNDWGDRAFRVGPEEG